MLQCFYSEHESFLGLLIGQEVQRRRDQVDHLACCRRLPYEFDVCRDDSCPENVKYPYGFSTVLDRIYNSRVKFTKNNTRWLLSVEHAP